MLGEECQREMSSAMEKVSVDKQKFLKGSASICFHELNNRLSLLVKDEISY